MIDQDENIIFSNNKDINSQKYEIELKKLIKIIKLISKNSKTVLDYHSKIQTIICSEIDRVRDNCFFLLIKNFDLDKTIIACFPSTTSHQHAYTNFKKTIKILSYFFKDLESPIMH